MNKKELKKILYEHKKWLCGEGGKRADLAYVNLVGVDLEGSNLTRASMVGAYLKGANLANANMMAANLSGADLIASNLTGTNLTNVILTGTNLSGCIGLLDPTKFMFENFEHDELGWIVYKIFGAYRPSPKTWKIEAGSIIEEVVNPARERKCGCGVNFAPLAWIKSNCYRAKARPIWRCKISWFDACGIVVPYGTDGVCRCSRMELIEVIGIV